ncbi:MAG: hypothetical protein SGCHY_003167 [Lobulomycetales sp.]
MLGRVVFYLALLCHLVAGQGCECLSLADTGLEQSSFYDAARECLLYTDSSSQQYCFPLRYGHDTCAAHDESLEPYCNAAEGEFPGRPNWCGQSWCWVNGATCTNNPQPSSFFPGNNPPLIYSYEACGSSNTFLGWLDRRGDSSISLTNLISTVEGYVVSFKLSIESQYQSLVEYSTSSSANTPATACFPDQSCDCETCSKDSCWGDSIDTKRVNVASSNNPIPLNQRTDNDSRIGRCLSDSAAFHFTQIGAKEYSQPSIGFQFFGTQESALLPQWPAVECSLAGPKDIVLVVDNSGSMAGTRIQLALAAVKAVIKTLTWVDYISLVLFTDQVENVYSETLVRATEANLALLSAWAQRNIKADGGTNFLVPLTRAYSILRGSLNSDDRTSCAQAIMFLTDGVADLPSDTMSSLASENPNVRVFSYALGSSAATEVTKMMACLTDGIFFRINIESELPNVLARYYEYFSELQEASRCRVTWISYTEAVTGVDVVSGCVGVYDWSPQLDFPAVIGAVCVDLNVLVSLDTLKTCTNYQQFIENVEREALSCSQASDISPCHLQKIRLKVAGRSAVCDGLAVPEPDTCTDIPTKTNGSDCTALDPNRFSVLSLDQCRNTPSCSKAAASGAGTIALSGAAMTGIVFGLLIGILSLILGIAACRRRRARLRQPPNGISPQLVAPSYVVLTSPPRSNLETPPVTAVPYPPAVHPSIPLNNQTGAPPAYTAFAS